MMPWRALLLGAFVLVGAGPFAAAAFAGASSLGARVAPALARGMRDAAATGCISSATAAASYW